LIEIKAGIGNYPDPFGGREPEEIMRKRKVPPRPRNPVAASIRSARWRTRRARSTKAYSRKGRSRERPFEVPADPPSGSAGGDASG
jgi:hypothetical protein